MAGKPKRLPHGGIARVAATCATLRKPKWMSESDWMDELKERGPCSTITPRIMVYVDTKDRESRRALRAMVHNTEVRITEEHDIGNGFRTAIVITGSIAQLKLAIAHSCVKNWQLVMGSRVGFVAQGGGQPKIKSHPGKKPIKESTTATNYSFMPTHAHRLNVDILPATGNMMGSGQPNKVVGIITIG